MGKINRICIIGAGHMGEAIAGGMISCSGILPENITVTARTRASLDRIAAKYPGISVSSDNAAAARGADLAVIAVKPWQTEAVAKEIGPALDYGHCTVASVAAGVSFRELSDWLRKGKEVPALARIIPNTAIALGQGTTFIAEQGVTADVCGEISGIFRKMGTVVAVGEEMMAEGTALASCGIAYGLKYIDAAIKGGIALGFGEKEARDIVISTMKGALALLETNGTMPQQEIDKVTTPGGYTFKGLSAMEECGFSEAVRQGLIKSV